MLTDPDLGKYEPVPDMMVPVFKAIAEPRPGGPSATLLPAELKEARRVAGLDPNEASARTTKHQDARKAGRQSASRGRPGQTVERD